MAEEFVSDTPDSVDTASSQPKRESVKILLIGSRRGINSIIYWLYRLGFSEVAAWSKPQIAPNSEDQQMMSINENSMNLSPTPLRRGEGLKYQRKIRVC